MKKIIVTFILLIIPFTVKAYDYTIDKYEIYIKVNEDNSYDITENITANFNVQKHGIYRSIPLKNEIVRADGSTAKTYAKVKNVSVDAPFETSNESGLYFIKIGSAYNYVTGLHTYMINYTYDLFRSEKNKNFDEFYFNLIGTDWDTTISNVIFNIEMPKSFDETKMGFSRGSYGTINSNDITYQVDGNIIKGSYNGLLSAHEALTIRIPLEEGYFKKRFNLEDLSIIISIVSLILSFILWFIYGRDEKAIETVEFYPPDNLNSLELGYMYRGNVRDKDVTSLLIYLANKGYVKISERKNTSLLSKNDFEITKLKDYDGDNNLEKTFMAGLFKYGSTKVTSNDLYDNFYRTTEKLKKEIMSKENHDLIFDKAVAKKANYNLFLMILTVVFTFLLPLAVNGYLMFGIMPIALILFYTPFYKMIIKTKSIFLAVFIIIHSSIFFLGMIGAIVGIFPYLITSFIVAIVCLILMAIIYNFMPKRNKYGMEILGKIKGFKNFLETVEKEQLEKLVLENPEYFYEILPYTYVLDISDTWINKFEAINLQAPNWYYGSEFEFYRFNHFITHTINDTRSFNGVKPSSGGSGGSFSSGGSSSGGGFSGGGSGGGGGGSW